VVSFQSDLESDSSIHRHRKFQVTVIRNNDVLQITVQGYMTVAEIFRLHWPGLKTAGCSFASMGHGQPPVTISGSAPIHALHHRFGALRLRCYATGTPLPDVAGGMRRFSGASWRAYLHYINDLDTRSCRDEWAAAVCAREHSCWNVHVPNRADPALLGTNAFYHSNRASNANSHFSTLLELFVVIPMRLAPSLGYWIEAMRSGGIRDGSWYDELNDYYISQGLENVSLAELINHIMKLNPRLFDATSSHRSFHWLCPVCGNRISDQLISSSFFGSLSIDDARTERIEQLAWESDDGYVTGPLCQMPAGPYADSQRCGARPILQPNSDFGKLGWTRIAGLAIFHIDKHSEATCNRDETPLPIEWWDSHSKWCLAGLVLDWHDGQSFESLVCLLPRNGEWLLSKYGIFHGLTIDQLRTFGVLPIEEHIIVAVYIRASTHVRWPLPLDGRVDRSSHAARNRHSVPSLFYAFVAATNAQLDPLFSYFGIEQCTFNAWDQVFWHQLFPLSNTHPLVLRVFGHSFGSLDIAWFTWLCDPLSWTINILDRQDLENPTEPNWIYISIYFGYFWKWLHRSSPHDPVVDPDFLGDMVLGDAIASNSGSHVSLAYIGGLSVSDRSALFKELELMLTRFVSERVVPIRKGNHWRCRHPELVHFQSAPTPVRTSLAPLEKTQKTLGTTSHLFNTFQYTHKFSTQKNKISKKIPNKQIYINPSHPKQISKFQSQNFTSKFQNKIIQYPDFFNIKLIKNLNTEILFFSFKNKIDFLSYLLLFFSLIISNPNIQK
jgi:hypothetical protein